MTVEKALKYFGGFMLAASAFIVVATLASDKLANTDAVIFGIQGLAVIAIMYKNSKKILLISMMIGILSALLLIFVTK